MNRAQRVLAFLEQRPYTWTEAVRFEPIGGRQAWRTAISEARALARLKGWDILNDTHRMRAANGTPFTLSVYMLVGPQRDLLALADGPQEQRA